MREQVRAKNAGICKSYAIALSCLFLAAGCSTIATYDQVAYEHATNATVDTLALMDKATSPYGDRIKDIEAFLNAAKADLQKYTQQLAAGQITPDEFRDLMQDEGDLAKMDALKEAVWHTRPLIILSTASLAL